MERTELFKVVLQIMQYRNGHRRFEDLSPAAKRLVAAQNRVKGHPTPDGCYHINRPS